MRLFKLIATFLILAVIALFVWQNMETWLSPTKYKLNLYFSETTFSIQLYVVILLSGFGGFLAGMLALLKPYFKTRRTLASERKDKKQAAEALTVKESPVEAS
ncbi:MAG: lipopolysaccharide assembly protein LapA domain-containing protein [Syntrophobacteraceae bacterium]